MLADIGLGHVSIGIRQSCRGYILPPTSIHIHSSLIRHKQKDLSEDPAELCNRLQYNAMMPPRFQFPYTTWKGPVGNLSIAEDTLNLTLTRFSSYALARRSFRASFSTAVIIFQFVKAIILIVVYRASKKTALNPPPPLLPRQEFFSHSFV